MSDDLAEPDAALAWSIDGLRMAFPELSARRVVTKRQGLGVVVIVALVGGALVLRPVVTASILMGVLVSLYLAVVGFRLDLLRRSARRRDRRVEVSDDDARSVPDDELPTVSVLVPAYREPEVMGNLLGNLAALDYPASRLQIRLLLEADDDDTYQAAMAAAPASNVEIVRVPVAEPRTKPKALNYALLDSTGDIVTIYDAEDRPEPLQLRRMAVAFARSGPEVGCLQAELAYFNADENLLTRWFAVEYRMWFTQLLPGLSASDAPIPLGGTSNHIRRDLLVAMGGWDPYNVTEDADLGVRLRRCGYRVALLGSVTEEEANTDVVNWVKQRSRWYKGYAQTWLVHMRHPMALVRDVGVGGFVRFNLFVGGTPALALLNPLTWLLLVTWFTLQPAFVRDIMPAPVYYAGLISWIAGNSLFYYLTLATALELRLRRVFWASLALPAYWLLMSLAGVKAFLQLVSDPNFWEKTQHGLTTMSAPVAEDAHAGHPA